MTEYIVLAQCTSDGDRAFYGVLNFGVEARDADSVARLVREEMGYAEAIAVIPARYFREYLA